MVTERNLQKLLVLSIFFNESLTIRVFGDLGFGGFEVTEFREH
jgi:hypothetical protein